MKNLKQWRNATGLSQTEFAKKIGVTKQTLYKWERGMSPVATVHWDKYSHILGIDANIFEDALIETLLAYALETLDPQILVAAQISGKYDAVKLANANTKLLQYINTSTPPAPDLEPYKEVKTPSGEGLFVPIISSAAAATCNPGLMPLLDCVNQYSEEKTWFRQAKEGDFVIEVIGDSMNPWYPEGTLLLVRPYQPLRNGQRVVAVLDSGEIIFKVYAEKDNKVCLFSISDGGKDFIFTKPMVPLRYICRVVASQRSEDDLDAEMHNVNMVHGWQLKLKEI